MTINNGFFEVPPLLGQFEQIDSPIAISIVQGTGLQMAGVSVFWRGLTVRVQRQTLRELARLPVISSVFPILTFVTEESSPHQVVMASRTLHAQIAQLINILPSEVGNFFRMATPYQVAASPQVLLEIINALPPPSPPTQAPYYQYLAAIPLSIYDSFRSMAKECVNEDGMIPMMLCTIQ